MSLHKKYPSDWLKYSADELFLIRGGTTPSKRNNQYWNTPDIHWATPTDFTKNIHPVYISNTKSKISRKALEECGLELINPGSVLMTSRATIGKALINTIPITTNQGFVIFTPSKKIISKFFLYWLQNSNKMLTDMASGSTFLEISKKTIKQLNITLPPLPEQKKIASILSSVDEAIQATQKVIDQTQKVKQGLLQELLTKGIGHTEFKKTEIGEIPAAWDVKTLEDISLLSIDCKNRTPPVTQEGFPVVRTPNVRDGEFVFTDLRYTDCESYEIWTQRGAPKPGDLLFTREAPLGEVALIPPELNSVCLGQRMMLFRINALIAVSQFVLQVLLTPSIKSRLMLNSGGSTVGHARVGDIKKFKIPIPPLHEQHDLASVLSSIDETINTEKEKKKHFNNIKKGLMQDLLSGKVRASI